METNMVSGPVNEKIDISGKKVIPSLMFQREKFTSTGEFEKLKSRLVAGGLRQDRTFPNANISAILTVLVIASVENRVIVAEDVPGAYLEETLVEEVFVQIGKHVPELLVKMSLDKYESAIKNDEIIVCDS